MSSLVCKFCGGMAAGPDAPRSGFCCPARENECRVRLDAFFPKASAPCVEGERDGAAHAPGECTCAEQGNDPGRCSERAATHAEAEEYWRTHREGGGTENDLRRFVEGWVAARANCSSEVRALLMDAKDVLLGVPIHPMPKGEVGHFACVGCGADVKDDNCKPNCWVHAVDAMVHDIREWLS